MRAYAKINLGLAVGGMTAGGLHEIDTVMAEVGLYDEVTVEESGGLAVVCMPEVCSEQENLCYTAMQLLGRTGRVVIEKGIPAGAGLGGGSSDAGAVLRAFGGDVASALRLGSDVPFFLVGGVQRVRGVGERVTPYVLPEGMPRKVVLVMPDIGVVTREAFMWLDEAGGGTGELRLFQNDFEGVVFARYPALREVRDGLLAVGARYALLSGTGSTVYGLFDAVPADIVRSFPSQYRVVVTEIREG